MFSDGRVPNFTEAVKLGLIDLKTGMYHDPHTGQRMFLSDAVKKGLIDTTGEMPLIGEDVSSYTLSQAIEMGIFDEETGDWHFYSSQYFETHLNWKIPSKEEMVPLWFNYTDGITLFTLIWYVFLHVTFHFFLFETP